MSRCLERIACVFSIIAFSVLFMMPTPAFAQMVGGGIGAAPPPVRCTLIGTDFQVTPAGSDAYNAMNISCPLRTLVSSQGGPEKYDAAITASRAAGDADSAPFAVCPAPSSERIYFESSDCIEFFRELSVASSKDGSSNLTIACAYNPPGEMRDACKGIIAGQNSAQRMAGGILAKQTGTPTTDLSREQLEEMRRQKEAAQNAERSCFEGTLDRVGQYWANQQSVACIRSATKFIRNRIRDLMDREAKHLDAQKTADLKGVGQGALTAVVAAPDALGIANFARRIIQYAAKIARIAADNSTDLGQLLNDCATISGGFSDMQVWRKGVLNGLCRQAESLVERQLTQCIRVNFAFDLSLPQFSYFTQCPVNLSLTAYVNSQGASFNFSCVRASPVTASLNWGGQSLLSGSGSIANIFNGDCFTSPAATPPTGATPGGRIPGIDCGPLSNDPIRSETLTASMALNAGPPVANGWVAGQSDNRAASPSGVIQQVTRCDFYADGERERTVYVYGSGASCNASTTGFTSGGFETNLACYTGSYQPATMISAPDSCMYPADCLGPDPFNFDPSRAGTGSCPANPQPAFDGRRSHWPVNTNAGGIGTPVPSTPAEIAAALELRRRPCTDFSGEAGGAPVCCDPQKQDCRESRARGVPLCVCDQGGSDNRLLLDGAGLPYPDGRCDAEFGGGYRTCCTPSLNGGINGCTTILGMPASQVCSDAANQCVNSGDVVGEGAGGGLVTAGQINTTKPSPFSYLVVRPDIELTTITNANGTPKQCCTTPWCNICPQHYANAYGLSMARAPWGGSRPAAGAPLTVVRTYNDDIVGQGWPFTTQTTEAGVTTYTPGVNPATLALAIVGRGPGPVLVPISNPILHMSSSMQSKLSEDQFSGCRNIGGWQIGYMDSSRFMDSDGELGYAYRSSFGFDDNREDWKILAPVPSPQETPLDYINRIQGTQLDPDGNPIEPIELCSDVVKVCTPGPGAPGAPVPPVAIPPGGGVPVPPVAVPPGGGGGGGPGGGFGVLPPPPMALRALPGGGAEPAPVAATPPGTPAPGGGGGSPVTPPGPTLVPGMGGAGTGSLF